MRVHDRTPPTPAGTHPGPGAPFDLFAADLFVAIEKADTAAPRWDDFVTDWDGGESAEVWDAPATAFTYTDATCDVHAVEFGAGAIDPEQRYSAGALTMTLDNRSGRWSSFDAFGRIIDYLPGRRIDVWAVLDGQPWWLWSGLITAWRQVGDTIDVEAFDDFTALNAHIGTYASGTAGQLPAARLADVLAHLAWSGPRRFDTGDVHLLAPTTDRTPLEEAQRVAESDAGVLLVDADGTLVYRDRRWSAGRDDQATRPSVSGNVCTADAVVWDLVLLTADDELANRVTLTNAATPTPITVTAVNTASVALHGELTLPDNRTDDLWTTTAEGQAVADFIAARRGDAFIRAESFALYLTDAQQDLWRLGIDLRLGDVIELVQDVRAADGALFRLDVFLVVAELRHRIVPGQWTVAVGTSRVVGNRPTYRWDQSSFAWDQSDPLNVWGN